MHPATPIPPVPPGIVRLSSGLLFAVGGLVALSGIVDLVFVNTSLSVYKDAYNGDVGSGFGSLVGMTVALFVAAGVSSLAIMNNHGSEKSRITTWVLGGIVMVCGGWGTLGGSFHRPKRSVDGDSFTQLLPAGYGMLTGLLDLLAILALLASLVLLALPPATRFFHERHPVGYVTIPVYQTTGDQPPLHPQSPPPHSPSYSSPYSSPFPQSGAFSPYSQSPAPQQPHSADIPMADPWASPDPSLGDESAEYRPRHG